MDRNSTVNDKGELKRFLQMVYELMIQTLQKN